MSKILSRICQKEDSLFEYKNKSQKYFAVVKCTYLHEKASFTKRIFKKKVVKSQKSKII